MAKIDKQPQTQQQQTFDELMSFLDLQFKAFPDHRAGNAVRYELYERLSQAGVIREYQDRMAKQPALPIRPSR